MLKGHEKLRLPDENKSNDLVLEVNWSKEPKIQECKVIKVTMGEKEAYIRKDHFMAAIFAFGSAGEQKDLIPHKVQTIRKYNTMLGITAKRDIKKGDKINVVVDIPLPPIEEEIIKARRNNLIPRA